MHSQSPGGLELARDAITGDGGGIVVVRNPFGLPSSFQRKFNG